MDSKRVIHLSDLRISDIEKVFKKTVERADVATEVPVGRLFLVTEDLHQKTLDIVKQCYIDDEPIGKSIGLQWSDEYKAFWINAIRANLSFILIDEDGEGIGLNVIRVARKEDTPCLENFDDVKLREIVELLSKADTEFFEKYKTEEAFHFLGLGVVKKYRGRGIGSFLVQTALKLVKELGACPFYIKVEGTSNFSKKIFEKYDFEAVKEFPYKEYMKNGNVVFDDTGVHKSIITYGKCISTVENNE